MLTLRFYQELNDFLPPERRKVPFQVEYALPRSVKDLIEALGRLYWRGSHYDRMLAQIRDIRA